MIFGNTLKGFDILTIDRDFQNELCLTLIQTKYAVSGASTKYYISNITESLNKMKTVLKPFVEDFNNLLIYNEDDAKTSEPTSSTNASSYIVGEYTLKAKQIRAVFALLAPIGRQLFSTEMVTILDWKDLYNSYGPTFWSLIREQPKQNFEFHDVETILEDRKIQREDKKFEYEYLVKWKHLSKENSEWIKESDFDDTKIIEIYRANLKKK